LLSHNLIPDVSYAMPRDAVPPRSGFDAEKVSDTHTVHNGTT